MSEITELQLDQIKPNENQPRKHFDQVALQELAESIQEVGLLNPVLVRTNGSGYELVHGERRWRASQIAGMETIRAEIRDLTDEQAFLIAFTENLQRDDLNPIEEAQALRALMDYFGYSQKDVAAKIGKSQPWISGRLSLLKLPDPIQDQVITRVISASTARELSRIEKPELQSNLAEKAASGNLTVRELEAVKMSEMDGVGMKHGDWRRFISRPGVEADLLRRKKAMWEAVTEGLDDMAARLKKGADVAEAIDIERETKELLYTAIELGVEPGLRKERLLYELDRLDTPKMPPQEVAAVEMIRNVLLDETLQERYQG